MLHYTDLSEMGKRGDKKIPAAGGAGDAPNHGFIPYKTG
jgi:hypothetical protein